MTLLKKNLEKELSYEKQDYCIFSGCLDCDSNNMFITAIINSNYFNVFFKSYRFLRKNFNELKNKVICWFKSMSAKKVA